MDKFSEELIKRIHDANPCSFRKDVLHELSGSINQSTLSHIDEYLQLRSLDVSECIELREYFFFRSSLSPKEKLLLDAIIMEQSVLRRSFYGLDVDIILEHFCAPEARYQLKMLLDDEYYAAASLSQVQTFLLWVSGIYLHWEKDATERGVNWNDEKLTQGIRNLALLFAAKMLGRDL